MIEQLQLDLGKTTNRAIVDAEHAARPVQLRELPGSTWEDIFPEPPQHADDTCSNTAEAA